MRWMSTLITALTLLQISFPRAKNIKAALIGPGVHASHAMERTHKQAVLNTVKPLAAYVS